MLNQITPLILTFNEEKNIARTLDKLTWANDVVIIDSGSTDNTPDICKNYDNVRFITRKFDTHTNQWNFGINKTNIQTEWVLALDADYVLTEDYIKDLKNLTPNSNINGYWTKFKYCIFGKALSGSLYPPVITLFRLKKGKYFQDGHTQRLKISGKSKHLSNYIHHDDRKSLFQWLIAQDRYAQLENVHLSKRKWKELKLQDKIRKLIFVSPIITPLYCLILKKGIFDGKIGWYYAFQRTVAEILLSLKLLENKIK